MLGGIFFKNCWLLRPGYVRKFPLFIAFRKVLGVGLKQHSWRYWISSVFVFPLVMIAIARCLSGFEMHMPYRPSVLFLCPFKISVLPLIIFIPFLSNMATQSSSHSWYKEISEALCNPSKMCTFFAWALRLIDRGCSLLLLHSSSCCLEIELLAHTRYFYICKYCRVFSSPVIIWRATVSFFNHRRVLWWVYNRDT